MSDSPKNVPHPNSPAGRTFDYSSVGVPHPNSPAALNFDYSSVGVPHPASPAALHFDYSSLGGTQRAPDPAGKRDPIWDKIEARLLQIYSLPHNALEYRRAGTSAVAAAKKKVAEIRSGLEGVPQERQFTGPKLFLRVVGERNRAYSGEWWFDADLHDSLEAAYSRIYFQAADRKAAVRDMLRELLAVSMEWNAMTEIWALELPPGETLTGFCGPGTPQHLWANLPLTEKGNRLLVGKAAQIFFPMKNPLWVRLYRELAG